MPRGACPQAPSAGVPETPKEGVLWGPVSVSSVLETPAAWSGTPLGPPGAYLLGGGQWEGGGWAVVWQGGRGGARSVWGGAMVRVGQVPVRGPGGLSGPRPRGCFGPASWSTLVLGLWPRSVFTRDLRYFNVI